MTDDDLDTDQKIPHWLMEVPFLMKVKTAFKSVMRSRFGIMVFRTTDAILGQWFFLFNKVNQLSKG